MNRLALFCDGTENYVIPSEPEANTNLTLKFRTETNDIDRVWLRSEGEEIPMSLAEVRGKFNYYSVEWHVTDMPFFYNFKIEKGREICYYGRNGVVDGQELVRSFHIVPGFTTPDWAKGAVMYQIFVDRFYNGDTTNDVVDREYFYIGGMANQVKDWNKFPENVGFREFYGGDLEGIYQKLDYLQELGVEALYLNPIFVSPSNHKYDIQDYDYVDPHYGKIVVDGGKSLSDGEINKSATKYQIRTTSPENLEASNKVLIKLVDALHERGMKIILDGVFNHCGSFNKWLDRERIYKNQKGYKEGAYFSKSSPYTSFFGFTKNDNSEWPCNASYDGWWGHSTLPKLNYQNSPLLEHYILEIAKKWVAPPYNIDGWRLDVAADLGYGIDYNIEFWRKFRKAVKEINPNAIIIAEHYGNPEPWLQGDCWDTIMNYDAFMEPVTWFLTGMEKHSDAYHIEFDGNGQHFKHVMEQNMMAMMTPSLLTAMNQLSNHDHSRFLTRTNRKVGRVEILGGKAANEYVNPAVMRLAVMMQMTWPGAPTIYYGDEVGLCGFTDPDNRRSYPWGNEDKDLFDFHKKMISIRKENEVLKIGSTKTLLADDKVVAFARFIENEQILVVINCGSTLKQVKIPAWMAEMDLDAKLEMLMYTYQGGYIKHDDVYFVNDGELYLNVGSCAGMVLRYKK